jgi:hypothetical protein
MHSRPLRLDGAALLLLIFGLALGAPAAATATVRYTSPGGTVASGPCTDAAGSCSIVHLFSVAANGDELVLKPGSYGSSSAPISAQLLTHASGLNVHGTPAAPARIYSNYGPGGWAMLFDGDNVTLSDVEVRATRSTALLLTNGVAERVVARGSAAGCQTGGNDTLRDSLCAAQGGYGLFVFTSSGVSSTLALTLRNVTVVGGFDGMSVSAGSMTTYDVTLSNVIASGGPGFFDIRANNAAGGNGMTVHVGYSNYNTSTVSGGAMIDTSPGHNQTAAPHFLNAAGGDYHEASGSPTIDKAVTSALNGGFDWEGLPRVFGAGTDIGADEFAPAIPVTGSATGVTTTGAHLAGTLTPNGKASYHFQFGPTTAYGLVTPTGSASGSAAQAVGALLTGLAPGTTYHYRLGTTNSSGTQAGADRTFTTSSPSSPLTPPTISKLKASRRVFRAARASTPLTGVTSRRHKKGTTFSFRLDKAASVTVRIERKLRGRRVKGRCRRATRRLRHRPRCTRYVRKVTLKRTGHAGLNKVRFTGRVHGRALRPGRYRATFRASNSAGKSKRGRLRFRIVRR